MLIVDHRVDAVAKSQGEQQDAKVFEGHSIVFLRSSFRIWALVLEHGSRKPPKEEVLTIQGHVKDLVDLPDLDAETDKATDFNDRVRLIVQNVQEHDKSLEHVEEHGSDGETFQGFAIVPKLDI